jgi:hypothetical protein
MAFLSTPRVLRRANPAMLRTAVLGVCTSLASLTWVLNLTGSSQAAAPRSTGESQFHIVLKDMQEALRDAEATVARIESTGLIDQASLEIEGSFDDLREAARRAYEIASEAVLRDIGLDVDKRAGRNSRDHTKKEGDQRQQRESVVLMETLENELLGVRRRIEGLIPRIAEIDAKIRTGDVIISDDVLRELNRAEADEFISTLTPKARAFYRKKLPHSFPDRIGSISDRFVQERKYCYAKLADYQRDRTPSVLKTFADLLVPPAHAGLAVGCLAICKASAGTACFGCVAAATGTGAALVNEYVNCTSNCGRCRWFRPWGCACRGVCLFGFLALVG